MNTPFLFVLLALVAYGLAYFVYGRWYDRTVWKPDAKKTTPAHMYTDGVEFFPVTRAVLWGYQWKSVAALGPVLGPFIALRFGWLPALLWIVLGNFFIGWLQDYGSIMVSVRNQGRSFGPISYEFTGASGRNNLLWFILFYLILISAVFIFLIATFFNAFPGTFVATLGVIATGVLVGQLLFKQRMNVGTVTLIALLGIVVSIGLGVLLPTPKDIAGPWTLAFWAIVVAIILYFASILPMPTFTQPINYVSFFPTFLAVILIIVGALLSPLTGVTLLQPALTENWLFPSAAVGPIWPILFVAIACGAISGWHSLVGSSSTSKQLDIEPDAHPVGAGAMLAEGMLALASLAAYMVQSPEEIAAVNWQAWVTGAIRLTQTFFPLPTEVLTTYFGLALIIFALTIMNLVIRFFRLVSAEVFPEESGLAFLGNKHVATTTGLIIPVLFAISGAWLNLWLYFGGSNQLLAGLAIMLITIHLARVKQPTRYSLIPALFMIATTLAALAYQTYIFGNAVLTGKPIASGPLAAENMLGVALAFNAVFTLVGAILFILGARMSYLTISAYNRFRLAPAPIGGAALDESPPPEE